MQLKLGNLMIDTPVVLAPMAGITNAAYRRLCAEQGAGLYVCEMITSRGIFERDAKSLDMLTFDPREEVRSVQLYGVDPHYIGRAVTIAYNPDNRIASIKDFSGRSVVYDYYGAADPSGAAGDLR